MEERKRVDREERSFRFVLKCSSGSLCVCLVFRSSALGILKSITLRTKQAASILQGRSE